MSVDLLSYLEAFVFGAWLLVLIYFAPDVRKAILMRAKPTEVFCSIWAFNGIVQIGAILFVIDAPTVALLRDPFHYWAFAFILTISGAVACLLLVYSALHYRRRRD